MTYKVKRERSSQCICDMKRLDSQTPMSYLSNRQELPQN